MSTARDIVIVRHPVHESVGKNELKALLGPEDPLPTIIDVPAVHIPYGEKQIDWRVAVDAQREQLATDYAPRIRHLDAPRVIYAGRAPIPLAMHLGFRLGPWHDVEAVQPRHDNRSWAWDAEPVPGFDLRVAGVPDSRRETAGEVVIRIATSYDVHAAHTHTVVPADAAIAEIDIFTTPIDPDAVHHRDSIRRVADCFREALTAVRNHLPNARAVHIFASVPMALAFQLGARIQANIDLPHIFTYQFNPDAPPFYHRAIDLCQEVGEAALLTAEQSKAASSLRLLWREQCDAVASFANDLRATSGTWLTGFSELEQQQIASALPPGWASLPNAGGTDLHNARLHPEPLVGDEPYAYARRAAEWALADDFLAALAESLPDEDDRRLAGVLFLFHEGFHRTVHGLTEHTARGVGRFPKAIEAADYQADLWAMVQAAELYRAREVSFLDRAIRVATNTMWSFTGVTPTLHVLELRAANRFLNWYWQAVQLRGERDFVRAITTLATPPTIELAGVQTTLTRGRPALVLSGDVSGDVELTLLRGNRVTTLGPTTGAPLRDIALGFYERNGERIQRALEGVFDTLPS